VEKHVLLKEEEEEAPSKEENDGPENRDSGIVVLQELLF
jgi:hypothetical protein